MLVRYWDTRTPTPAHSGALPERVYAMDLREDLLVSRTRTRATRI
jgi:mRNA export factor